MKTKLLLIITFFYFLPLSLFSQCWQSISAGKNHNIALNVDGSLWGWGFNSHGIGNGTAFSAVPIQIGSDLDWKYISATDSNNLLIKSDGSLWGWGYNWFGQLGDGTNTDQPTLKRIGIDTDWELVSAGDRHTMAIKKDKTLWAWGSNVSGELGNGSTTNTNFPILIETINDTTKWQLVFAGEIFTIAIKIDGTLWAWGANSAGQLGDGTTDRRIIPTKIGIDTNWKSVAVGYQHTIALKTDGTLWAWGSNVKGQLGDGTNEKRTIPTKIGTDTDWESIDAGSHHTLAIKTDGTLWAWGLNGAGSLGDNTTVDKNIPTQIGTDTNWKLVSAGDLQSKAIKTNGNLWAWGTNTFGQTGNGSTSGNIKTPVLINCVILSNSEISLKRNLYSISSNPTHSVLNIQTAYAHSYQIQIVNQLGQLVLKQNQNTSSKSLDVSNLSKGLYFLNIHSETGETQTIKFIKN